MRRAWYWQEHDDEDLKSHIKRHLNTIEVSKYEINRAKTELRQRRLYDQVTK